MALRHLIPQFSLRDIDRTVEPVKPPPVMRSPVKVGFRKDAALDEVVDVVKHNKTVAIDAAAGAGKTVVVPPELCKSMGTLVIHSFPSIFLAYDAQLHVSKTVAVPTAFIEDCSDDMPNRGIVYTSNAVLVARLLQNGEIADVPVVLYMDEVHESDAYTYILKTLAPALPGVISVVHSTATADIGDGRKRELGGTLQEKTYSSKINPKDWDVFDEDNPWAVSCIRGNALLYVDSLKIAKKLRVDYQECGFNAFVFRSNMSVAEYAKARTIMLDESEGISVAIVDYSFRSGFTFPDIELIIDSGDVPYVIDDKGTPQKIYRRTFALERYQTSGRGARVPGTKCVVYMPDDQPKSAICDLEGVEMDAAAVIFRVLGYKPPHVLRASKCVSGKIPKDLCSALRGAQPFGCMSPDLMVDLSQVTVAMVDQHIDDMIGNIDISSPAVEEVAGNATDLIDAQDQSVGNIMSHLCDGMTSFRALIDRMGNQHVFKLGQYYMSADVINAPDFSDHFPDGVASVRRFILRDDLDFRLTCLPASARAYMAKQLFSAYNLATAEYLALRRLATDAPVDHLNRHAIREVVRDWAVGVMESVADKVSQIDKYSQVIPKVVVYSIEVIPPLVEVELQFAASHAARLTDSVTEFGEDYKGNYHASLISSKSTKRALVDAARGGPCARAISNAVDAKGVGFQKVDRLIEDVSDVWDESRDRAKRSHSKHRRKRSHSSEAVVAKIEPKPGGSSVWNLLVKKMANSANILLEPVPVRRR